MTNMKEAILELALDKFKAEIANPASPVAIKFNTMLYGDPANNVKGLFDKFTNYDDGLPQPDVEEEIKRYKRTPLQTLEDNMLGTAGIAAKGAGDVVTGGSSLLGDALMRMSKSNAPIQNPLAPFMGAAGGVVNAGGKLAGGALGLLGNAISSMHKDIQNNREKEREAELLIREHPNGAFYDARRMLTTGVQKGY